MDCDCVICQDRLMPERKPRSLKMASCLVFSCLVLSCVAWSALVLSCLVWTCLVLSGLFLPCLAWTGLVLSCILLVVAIAGGCKHHVKRRSVERDEPDRGDIRGATQKNVSSFGAILFLLKNHRVFAKTGSGQTFEKLESKWNERATFLVAGRGR
eukprot:COSAG06_NODE_34027_length_480_cov_9.881890_1_plen_154_part_01